MRLGKLWALSSVTALALLLCGIALAAGSEHLNFKFDDRKWTLGFEHEDEGSWLKEYVLDGQSVDNWTELVTEQFFPDSQPKATARQFMESFVEKIHKASPKVVFQVLSEADTDVLFQWQIKGDPNNQDQFELDRIVSGRTGLHFLHYVIKPTMSDAQRTKWMDLLKAAKVVGA